MKILETKRLTLRPMTNEDVSREIELIDTHPDEWKYDPGYERSRQEKEAELIFRLLEYSATGLGSLEIIEKASGAFIGNCGLRARMSPLYPGPDGDANFITEIYYKLRKDYWAKGYALEAVTRMLEYGFSELKFTAIIAGRVHQDNSRSIKLMRRIGMDIETDKEKDGCVRGVLLRKNWELAKS